MTSWHSKQLFVCMISIFFIFQGQICVPALKVNGYTFRGSSSAGFLFAFFFNRGQLLKERICSSRSKFFPLRVDLLLKGFRCLWKQSGSHKSCSPLGKLVVKHQGVPIHLNVSSSFLQSVKVWLNFDGYYNSAELPNRLGLPDETVCRFSPRYRSPSSLEVKRWSGSPWFKPCLRQGLFNCEGSSIKHSLLFITHHPPDMTEILLKRENGSHYPFISSR